MFGKTVLVATPAKSGTRVERLLITHDRMGMQKPAKGWRAIGLGSFNTAKARRNKPRIAGIIPAATWTEQLS
jgi:hypothetical protein